MAAEFELHELAVEDAISAHQRPKLERYGDTLFVVLLPARYLDDVEKVEFGELHVFVGPNFVITIRHGRVARPGTGPAPAGGAPRTCCAWAPRRCSTRSSTRWSTSTPRSSPGWRTTSTRSRTSSSSGDPQVSRRIYELSREVIEFQRATHSAARHPARPGARLRQVRRRHRAAAEPARRRRPRRAAGRAGRRVPAAAAERAHGERHPGRAAAERGDAAADRGQPRPERGGQEDLRMGGHPVRPDPDRHHLRDELRRTCPNWAGRSATRWRCC